MAGRLVVVVGGQFGSEGKGAAAGRLAQELRTGLAIRTGGPNAGHTVVGPDGAVHKLRQLPTAAVTAPHMALAIAAGGLVDMALLENEVRATGRKLFVDENATILEPRHIDAEQMDPEMQWGSTCKGIGAARMDRLHRTARTWGAVPVWYQREGKSSLVAMGADVAEIARGMLRNGDPILIEAAQGYGLGLHTEYYPRTTSADCRAIDALADAGISPWHFGIEPDVWVVVRPYPIRVAGDSGILLGETSWDKLGLPEERTTVTNKVRRVGQWDPDLVTKAITANGGYRGCRVWLSMVDQVVPEVAGMTVPMQLRTLDPEPTRKLDELLHAVRDCGARIGAIGTGPATAVLLPSGGW